MSTYNRDGTVGPWAAEKLHCLEKYLAAYTTILRKQTWCTSYIYIDAFAGAGRAMLRQRQDDQGTDQGILFEKPTEDSIDDEAEAYINGSPRVALGINHPFSEYIFIELEADRLKKLEELKSEFAESREITVIPGDANWAIEQHILRPGKYNWSKTRGVAFLDPFGLQVPWETIEALAKTKAIEVLVNLPVGMTLQRMLPVTGAFSAKMRDRLTAYFGSPDWESELYTTNTGLLGDEWREKRPDSGELLARWYQRRMAKVFGCAAPPRLIRNSNGGHLYYLIWAGPNRVGQKIASHVLDQGNSI